MAPTNGKSSNLNQLNGLKGYRGYFYIRFKFFNIFLNLKSQFSTFETL